MDAAVAAPLRGPKVPSAWTAALAGWLVPGLGHVVVGRAGRGLYFAAIVLATYAGGLALSDFRAVSWEREPVWFAAETLAGLPTALAALATQDLEIVRRIPTYDVGILYCAVASLLNAVVVADALGLVDEARQEARRRAAEEGARAAVEVARAEAEAAAAAAALATADVAVGTADAVPPVESVEGAPPSEPAAGGGTDATPAARTASGIHEWPPEGAGEPADAREDDASPPPLEDPPPDADPRYGSTPP